MNEQKKFRDVTVEMIMLCAAAFAEITGAVDTTHENTQSPSLQHKHTASNLRLGGKEGDGKLQGQMIIRDDPVGIWPGPLAAAWCSGW